MCLHSCGWVGIDIQDTDSAHQTGLCTLTIAHADMLTSDTVQYTASFWDWLQVLGSCSDGRILAMVTTASVMVWSSPFIVQQGGV